MTLPGMAFVAGSRGPIPERNNSWPTRRACGYAPTGAGAPSTRMMSLAMVDADVPGFGEETHGFESAFAAHAGLLRAAERRAQVAQHPAVDPDDAEIELRRDAMRAGYVARP